MFQPKFFSLMKSYNRQTFFKDLTAGTVVAIIALPLSIALAIASGVSPEKGLHTAIIAGFLISFLGGSRVQIGGPTGAFVIIVFGIVQKYGIDGLIISTMMAGVFLIIFGLLKMGSFIRFIPHPITTGFTSGIAVVIFTTQVKDFLGLGITKMPSGFINMWKTFILNFSTINPYALGIGLLALLIIIFWPKLVRNIPGSLIAIIVATLLVQLLNLPVETVGSRFGELSSALPRPGLPHVDLATISDLVQPAITIALLAGIESLLSAVVADGMIGSTHRPNTELIAQGIANMGSALFGGIPATGAIARTAANINNGGRTPVAGMTHAVVLLLMLVALMPLAAYIPMTALAAVLIMVAYNMSEWRTFKALLKAPKSDIAVLLITFGLTVFIDLVVAIEVGMVMAALLFMKRMSDVSSVELLQHMSNDTAEAKYRDFNSTPLPAGTGVFEINGPFFFGAADQFLKTILEQKQQYKILILRMRNVPAMDATGFHALNRIYKECHKKHITLLISNPQDQPRRTMEKAGFIEKIGAENICSNYESALQRAAELSVANP